MLSVMASVGVAGTWPTTADIRCIASRENPIGVFGPWMQGRHAVPYEHLIDHLLATLKEREQVLEMAAAGISGPYVFAESTWKYVDLGEGLDTP